MNNIWIELPTVVVKKINFMAELPQDLYLITRVKRCKTGRQIPLQNEIENAFNKEAFSVSGNRIYFSGAFSCWWMIRIWQKFKEKRNPIKYKIEYYTVKMYEQLMNKKQIIKQ